MTNLNRTISLATIIVVLVRVSYAGGPASNRDATAAELDERIAHAWEQIDHSPAIPNYLKEDAKQEAALTIYQNPDRHWTSIGKYAARGFLRREYEYAKHMRNLDRVAMASLESTLTEETPQNDRPTPAPGMDDSELGEVIAYGAYKYRKHFDSSEFIDIYGQHYPGAAAIAREVYPDILTKPNTFGARARRTIERAQRRSEEPSSMFSSADGYPTLYDQLETHPQRERTSLVSNGGGGGFGSAATRSDPVGNFLGGLLSKAWLVLAFFALQALSTTAGWSGGVTMNSASYSYPTSYPTNFASTERIYTKVRVPEYVEVPARR